MMERECRARKNPNRDGVCFHAQQCSEKLLKVRLTKAGILFGKTHDLVALLKQTLVAEPCWESFRENLAFLSDFSVIFRIPGESAYREQAKAAQRRCRLFRKEARKSMEMER